LTRAMAEAWSPFGIVSNAVAPGFFPTELTRKVYENPELLAHNAAMTAIGRNGELSDLDGVTVFLASAAAADQSFGKVSRPDGHAPISVMGDHMHKKGEWMLSYRYMFMDMDGNRDGTRRVSDDAVLADYPVTPRKMDMEMHMLGVMYGLTDRVTLMAMMPFARLDMDHRTRMGARFNTRSTGIGDLKLSGMVTRPLNIAAALGAWHSCVNT